MLTGNLLKIYLLISYQYIKCQYLIAVHKKVRKICFLEYWKSNKILPIAKKEAILIWKSLIQNIALTTLGKLTFVENRSVC